MKKYSRSINNKILFGVFGGLGEYYDTDPSIYRLVGIFLFFLSGIVPFVLAYTIAIFMIAKTGEEKKQSDKRRKTFLWIALIIIAIFVVIPVIVMLLGFSLFKASSSYQESHYFSPRDSHLESQVVYELPIISQDNINDYLNENIISAEFDGEIFSHFHTLSVSENKIYVWALVSEYYLDGLSIKKGTSISTPLSLSFKNDEITGHLAARSGSYYLTDIEEIFPDAIHQKVLNFQSQRNEVIQEMENYIYYKAISYFDI